MTKLVNKSGPIQFNLPNGDKSPIFQNGDKAAEWYVNHYPLSGQYLVLMKKFQNGLKLLN